MEGWAPSVVGGIATRDQFSAVSGEGGCQRSPSFTRPRRLLWKRRPGCASPRRRRRGCRLKEGPPAPVRLASSGGSSASCSGRNRTDGPCGPRAGLRTLRKNRQAKARRVTYAPYTRSRRHGHGAPSGRSVRGRQRRRGLQRPWSRWPPCRGQQRRHHASTTTRPVPPIPARD